ncbi:flippase-like domain-containing protein [Conexibacter stalactiti]|uniref:Flippase-like domain-containing protein n=1 Tax=Conexibacter stalactiti TaxID=1940611 RepID=A0ABU4HRB2_9ACTN|nr:flippase-like domain-containing protein [Conexibacter stalactiti]MDW5595826.1 flippase-like domain-containing protein [Conexibacter stalactiti]MEC5036468.1 flippase-like domain-containing protein [Conexibacter stalactiti]
MTPPPPPTELATSTTHGTARDSRQRTALPSEFEPRRLIRHAIQVAAIIGVLVLVALLAPGLGEVRRHLGDAKPAWIAVAVGFELLSCISYVLMFRPVFCRQMPWKTASQIGWSELAMGSIVPASGAAGLALGAWALVQGGMSPERVARRSVAFFLIKSSVNFVAVAVIGIAVALGLFGPDLSLWLTAFPAALSLLVISAILLLPRLGEGRPAPPEASRLKRGIAAARRSVIAGTRESVEIVKGGDPLVIVGALGYWAWDNAVLWATFHAFGANIDISIILLGYLIGQLGGLLPIPGGIGGIDGGLIGTLIVFGAPAAATAAAVLVYRVILFWLPLIGGAFAFVSLRRTLARDHEDIFTPC